VFRATGGELEEAEPVPAAWRQDGGAIARDGNLLAEAIIRHPRLIRAHGARIGLL